jgi:hypothetical protein
MPLFSLLKVFNVAQYLGVERIHVCFFHDSSALLESVGAISLPAIPSSVSIFGLGAFRDSASKAIATTDEEGLQRIFHNG